MTSFRVSIDSLTQNLNSILLFNVIQKQKLKLLSFFFLLPFQIQTMVIFLVFCLVYDFPYCSKGKILINIVSVRNGNMGYILWEENICKKRNTNLLLNF